MILYFIIPCYNDADVLPISGPVVLQKLHALIRTGEIDDKSRIVFLNDGSTDTTWDSIVKLHTYDSHCVGINLAKNVGEQRALITGMFYAKEHADCCITMDSDLQDDIKKTNLMLRLFQQGKDIVFGVRCSRKSDPFIERITSSLFYIVMRFVEKRSISNHSNFRLMSNRAIQQLESYLDKPFFLPVLVASFDLPSAIIYYDRHPRAAGTSGYSFSKRLRLGLGAVMSHLNLRLNLFHIKEANSLSDIKIHQILE